MNQNDNPPPDDRSMDRWQLEADNAELHQRRRQRRRQTTVPPDAFALQAPPAEPAPVQPELAIEHAPQRLRDHGYRDAHSHPLVSPDTGKVTRTWRVPAPQAWDFPRLELRAGNSWPCVIIDCDGSDSLKRLGEFVLDEGLPTPSCIVRRKASGNIHATYFIDPPVHRPCDARQDVKLKPLQLFGRVSEYLTEALGGDPGYNGVLTHNPEWPGPEFHTDYLREKPWTLAELNAAVPRGWRIPARPLTAVGRNVALFGWAVKEAHRPRSAEIIRAYGSAECPEWERIVHARYEADHGDAGLFGLPDVEIAGIARSAARYSLRQWTPGKFIESQRAHGRGGKVKQADRAERNGRILELLEAGHTQRQAALSVGCNQATVSRLMQSHNR